VNTELFRIALVNKFAERSNLVEQKLQPFSAVQIESFLCKRVLAITMETGLNFPGPMWRIRKRKQKRRDNYRIGLASQSPQLGSEGTAVGLDFVLA
jgi:hypothetical protein